jgi:hypothetical protein
MTNTPSAGNFLSFIEEGHHPEQVVRWFAERGWSSSEFASGCFIVRSGDVELVVSPGAPALRGGREVVVRGYLRDAEVDGPKISEIIKAAVVSYRTRWGDLDGEGWSGGSVRTR